MTPHLSSQVRRRWLGGLSFCLLLLTGTACSGTPNAKDAMNTNTTSSLVQAWHIQLRPAGDAQVRLSFRPLVSSAKKYVGADYRSDGKTLWVTIKSCLVNAHCTAMSPAQPVPGSPDRFTYGVVLPYQGETVMIQGQGDVLEVVPLSR